MHGIVRRVALEDPENRLSRLQDVRDRLRLHAASLESYASLSQVVAAVKPHECYHLAAQSYVSYSFDDEFSTLQTNINGTTQTQARLGLRKTTDSPAGSSRALFKAGPPPINASRKPKSCCYTGTQAPIPYRP